MFDIEIDKTQKLFTAINERYYWKYYDFEPIYLSFMQNGSIMVQAKSKIFEKTTNFFYASNKISNHIYRAFDLNTTYGLTSDLNSAYTMDFMEKGLSILQYKILEDYTLKINNFTDIEQNDQSLTLEPLLVQYQTTQEVSIQEILFGVEFKDIYSIDAKSVWIFSLMVPLIFVTLVTAIIECIDRSIEKQERQRSLRTTFIEGSEYAVVEERRNIIKEVGRLQKTKKKERELREQEYKITIEEDN